MTRTRNTMKIYLYEFDMVDIVWRADVGMNGTGRVARSRNPSQANYAMQC
jgi:hypothetical protein